MHIGIYCDLGVSKGAGHFVRCSALGAALRATGAAVSIAADFSEVPWARPQAEALGLNVLPVASPGFLPKLAADWDAAVIDSYIAQANDVAGMPVPLTAIDDEALRPLPATLVINQNLSALTISYSSWSSARILRGPEFALLRPQFTSARPTEYQMRTWDNRPQRILLVLGSTDVRGATARLASQVLTQLAPVELHVITANPAMAEAVQAITTPAGSSIRVTNTLPNIETAMSWADMVVSAAGTTVWELCCLGVPMALVRVAPNQDLSYAAAVDAGIALGLGDVDEATASTALWSALADVDAVNATGQRAWQLVDGAGADRCAREILAAANSSR